MKIYYLLFLFIILISCTEKEPCKDCESCAFTFEENNETLESVLANEKNSHQNGVDTLELKESIAKIEEKYGEQWDFCNCVVKGDSINKAFSKPNLPDAEFNRLSDRFDEIDEKCQAFRIQDANRTPEQRALHEKKVKKCLSDAGVKN